MQRINTTNKATDLFGAGKHGYRPGNPATGQNPTDCSPDAFNALQEEVASVIEGAGLALNAANNAQLLASIQALISSRNFSGLVRSLTPIGGALVREYADIANAASVGGIEIGLAYNCAVDTLSGVWAGRDVADICWLEKWHDTAGTKELWMAPAGAAGVAPAWVCVFSLNALTGALTVLGTITAAQSTSSAHLITQGQVDARIAAALANALPTGAIFDFAGGLAPAGSMACPVAQTNISRATYAALFTAIGTTWGVGDGATTFGMPWFPADYAAVQASANVGTQTAGSVIAHSHSFGGIVSTINGGGYPVPYGTGTSSATNATGGAANLAAGVRVLKCIKY